MKYLVRIAAIWLCLPLVTAHAQQNATKTFRTRLSPVPVPAFNPNVVGSGTVTATLSGRTLTVNGTYQGLASGATFAQIHRGRRTGVRGDGVFDLTVSGGTS